MGGLKKFVGLVVIAAMVTFSVPAKAETTTIPGAPSIVNQILQILEGTILTGGIPSVVAIAGCLPSISFQWVGVDLTFARSATCPIAGTMDIALFPLAASVHLTVNDPLITAIDGDFTFSISKTAAGARQIKWELNNGYVTVNIPGVTSGSWAMTGEGTRTRVGELFSGNLTVNSRLNVFDKTSGSGWAVIRTVTPSTTGGAANRSAQGCALTGASDSDPMSGTTASCVTF